MNEFPRSPLSWEASTPGEGLSPQGGQQLPSSTSEGQVCGPPPGSGRFPRHLPPMFSIPVTILFLCSMFYIPVTILFSCFMFYVLETILFSCFIETSS